MVLQPLITIDARESLFWTRGNGLDTYKSGLVKMREEGEGRETTYQYFHILYNLQ
jgi:hypothetical protein